MQPILQIYDDFSPSGLLRAAYQVFRELVIPPSLFYLPLSALSDDSAITWLKPYLPESAARYVAHHLALLLNVLPSHNVRAADGFEFWIGITIRAGQQCYLHVDHDETQRRAGRGVFCPILATIFHLGPESGLEGWQTLFDLGTTNVDEIECCFSTASWKTLIRRCAAPLIVPRRPGRLIVFRGTLPHAVGPITMCDPNAPRVAFLANLWERRPASVPVGVCGLTPKAYKPLRLDIHK
jgi:hypothetical protein